MKAPPPALLLALVLLQAVDGRSRRARRGSPLDFVGEWLGGLLKSIPGGLKAGQKRIDARDRGAFSERRSNFFSPRRTPSALSADHGFRAREFGLCNNNKICDFTACMAKNFKNSPRLDDLQIFGQVLADPGFRKDIIQSPEVVNVACQEARLIGPQCKIFHSGIKFIDGFMNIFQRPRSRREKREESGEAYDYYSSGEADIDFAVVERERQKRPQPVVPVVFEKSVVSGAGQRRVVPVTFKPKENPAQKCLKLLPRF